MMDIIARGMAATALAEVVTLRELVVTSLAKVDLIKIVSELPEMGEENKIYLVPKSSESSEQDYYDEYLWVNKGTETEPNYKWEFVASRAYNVDLSNYATKDYVVDEISKNDIIRTEYETVSITETFEIEGEVINIELIDSETSETVIANIKTVKNESSTLITVTFTSVPTHAIKVVIFSTK